MDQPQQAVRLSSRERLTAVPHQAEGTHGAHIGRRFLDTLMRRDRAALMRLLAPQVRFRAMALDRRWESQDATEIVDEILFGDFFGPDVVIEKLHSADFGNVADVNSTSYYLQMRRDGKRIDCQQHLFIDLEGGLICSIHLTCSGFQEIPED